jgi:hypothetical protein
VPEAAVETTFPAENGPPTVVRFRNRTDDQVKLYWLPGDGTRTFYEVVAPGSTQEQHTFAGHHWLVTDPDDKAISVFVAARRTGLAEVRGPAKP